MWGNYYRIMSDDESFLKKSVYSGTIASPGIATGSAHTIEINQPNKEIYPKRVDITGLESIKSGDIVVTPDMFPNMIEYIRKSSGLIIYAEQGIAERGSVVARQELPALINCPEVVSEIQSGQQVTVDADEGQISLYQP